MFDLTIPLMFDLHLGTTFLSVAGSDAEGGWLVRLCKGVSVAGLLRMWREEANAVLGGVRQKGLLPMQVRRDWKNRIGCTRGMCVYRKSNQIFVCDEAEIYGSFLVSPKNWWKHVAPLSATLRTRRKDLIGPIEVASFASWMNRLNAAICVNESTAETFEYYRDVRRGNAGIVSNALSNISGGKELLSKFPRDYMRRLMFIRRREDKDKEFGIGWEAGESEFDGVMMMGERDVNALIWWINGELVHDREVAFLCPGDVAEEKVSLFVIRPDDNVTAAVSEALSASLMQSESLDHVIFSLECDSDEPLCGSGKVLMSKRNYLECLNHIERVAMGIVRGSAWAEFNAR